MNTLLNWFQSTEPNQIITYAIVSFIALLILLYKAGTSNKLDRYEEQYDFAMLSFNKIESINTQYRLVLNKNDQTFYFVVPEYVYLHEIDHNTAIIDYYKLDNEPMIEAHINPKNSQDFRIIDSRF